MGNLFNKTSTEPTKTEHPHSYIFNIVIQSVQRWERRHDCSSWRLFSLWLCFRKEMSSRIDPGIKMKELGGLYINFDGSKSKPVSSSLQKLKEKKIQDEVNWFFFSFWKVNRDAERITNIIARQGQVKPITPEMVLFMVSLWVVRCL